MKVPMPEADFGREGTDKRMKMILEYGLDTVQWAEMATVIQILFYTGIIGPNDFADLVEKQCKRVDDRRRTAAGYRD